MEITVIEFESANILGNSPNPPHPACNDLRSLDEVFEERLAIGRHWKYMPAYITKKLSLSQRIERAEMLKVVAKIEAILEIPL